MIFADYISGMGCEKIASKLNQLASEQSGTMLGMTNGWRISSRTKIYRQRSAAEEVCYRSLIEEVGRK